MDRRTAISAIGGTLLGGLSPELCAQSLSGRTLRFLVGYPAGGVADFIARTTTDGLRNQIGATAVVENKAGAAGNIALEVVAKAPPDAGVFGAFGNLQLTLNPLVPQLASKNVDAMRDLVPVVTLVDMILVLAVSSQFGARTLDQFLAKARDMGPQLRIGLAGIGTPHHMAALLLQRNAGLNMTMVPYKGGAPMIADAAGGHLDAVITTLPVGGPMVAMGKLNWIAIVQPTKIASLPDVPSLAPVLKGETVPTGQGVFAPVGTPAAVLNELHEALRTLVNSPAISAKMRGNGLEPVSIAREETAERIRQEAAYMKSFLAKGNIDFST